MKARKYKESYRVIDSGDARIGRREVEYTGEYFGYPAGTPTVRQRAARLAAWSTLYWLLTLAYLRTGRATGRCLYALMPVLIGLLPGAYAVMGVAAMLRAPLRMTVVQKENGPGRLVRSMLGCGLFGALGCLGCAVYITRSGLWPAAWHEPLLTALAALAGWLGFALARRDYRALQRF